MVILKFSSIWRRLRRKDCLPALCKLNYQECSSEDLGSLAHDSQQLKFSFKGTLQKVDYKGMYFWGVTFVQIPLWLEACPVPLLTHLGAEVHSWDLEIDCKAE